MAAAERKELILQLEEQLQCRVIVLVTGDRQGMETKLAGDVLSLVSEHLSGLGFTKRLALFLYTPGGDTIAAWGLVNLLRQYCEHLLILVPFRALSAGTLIALDADDLLLGKHGLLSPIDPSVNSPYNPAMEGAPPGSRQLLPVSVEDVSGFLDLAREEVGIKSEEIMVEVLKLLAAKIHPLALGAVYRAREQSGDLALRLLARHVKDKGKAKTIVDRLTKELPTHSYLIGRNEASEEIGLTVTPIDDATEVTMWHLYKQYEEWLQLTQPTSPDLDLAEEQAKRMRYDRAAVETVRDGVLHQHVFVSHVHLQRVTVPAPGLNVPVNQVAQRVLYQGWSAATDGELNNA